MQVLVFLWIRSFLVNECNEVLVKFVHFLLGLLLNVFLRGLRTLWWMCPLVLESRCVPSKWNKLVPHEREQRCILLNFVWIFLRLRRHSWVFPLLLMCSHLLSLFMHLNVVLRGLLSKLLLAAAEEEVEVEEAEDTEPLEFYRFEHSGWRPMRLCAPCIGMGVHPRSRRVGTPHPEDRCLDGGDDPLCGVQGKKASGCDCLWLYCGFWKYFSYFLVLLCPW